jgi:hypothetical protein
LVAAARLQRHRLVAGGVVDEAQRDAATEEMQQQGMRRGEDQDQRDSDGERRFPVAPQEVPEKVRAVPADREDAGEGDQSQQDRHQCEHQLLSVTVFRLMAFPNVRTLVKSTSTTKPPRRLSPNVPAAPM